MGPMKRLGFGLALAGLLAAGSPAAAGGGPPLHLKRFLLGYLAPDTNRFVATGARGVDNAFRDNVLLLVFSAGVDLETVNARTVQVGIPTAPGQILQAEGAFHPYSVRRFNPITGAYETKRTWKNRVIYDPLRRSDPTWLQNPDGFAANTLYTVSVPGEDRGYLKTVESRRGEANRITFETFFRTTAEYLDPWR